MRHLSRCRARLGERGALRTLRAIGWRVRRDVDGPQGMQRYVKACSTSRAVDEDRRTHGLCAGPPHSVERVLDGSAGRHDVIDDENALRGSELEPAPELPATTVLHAFGVDRAQLQLSRDLMRENDAAGRRPGDGLRR